MNTSKTFIDFFHGILYGILKFSKKPNSRKWKIFQRNFKVGSSNLSRKDYAVSLNRCVKKIILSTHELLSSFSLIEKMEKKTRAIFYRYFLLVQHDSIKSLFIFNNLEGSMIFEFEGIGNDNGIFFFIFKYSIFYFLHLFCSEVDINIIIVFEICFRKITLYESNISDFFSFI